MNLGNVHVKLLLFLVIQQAYTDCSPGTIYKPILWSMHIMEHAYTIGTMHKHTAESLFGLSIIIL